MTKALFFDIDGTLVSFKTHVIPQSAIDAIKEVRSKGHKVFICTGRPVPFINNLGPLEYDGIVSVNGACCSTVADGTIYRNTVSRDDIERIVSYQRTHPISIAFVNDEEAFLVNPSAEADEVYRLLAIPTPKVLPVEHALEMDVLQVIAFFTRDDEEYIMKNVLKGCDVNRWHPAFADCIVKGTNKATGIDIIARHIGIDVSNTIAFGDGGNDIAMLRHAGIGVAMGNASDEVKSHADYVTTSVDEDGIANALKELF